MEILSTVWGFLTTQFNTLKPAFVSKNPHFNFISVHYFWIIGLALFGSILIIASANGDIQYIDALFFATGACTQAGLNPVDVNLLNTFQQVVISILAMVCSPITINMSVLLLRLYWFEKRFQNVARDARLRRATLSKTKGKGYMGVDSSQLERGVNGRNITVMHNNGGARSRITNDGILLSPVIEKDKNTAVNGTANGNANGNAGYHGLGLHGDDRAPDDDDSIDPKTVVDPNQPTIKFSETVTRSDGLGTDAMKTPPTANGATTTENHVAILERQRNQTETLKIPGPRDVERGMMPSRIEHAEGDEDHPLEQSVTARTQAITIEEPRKPEDPDDQPQGQAGRTESSATGTAPHSNGFLSDLKALLNIALVFRFRVPRIFRGKNQKLHEDTEDKLRSRQQEFRSRRTKTLANIRTAFAQEKIEGMPYLSWQPTLGRNSAFPNMSEAQRDELGGIEYRSLKTLAILLMTYFWGFTILGTACMLPWILRTEPWGGVVDAASQSRVWWGFFTSNSAFMDLGFTLTADSMISFNTAVFPLIFMSFLIIAGNTGFPILLRFFIWVSSLCVPVGTGIWEELRFLLDHPRRCFTLLFPSSATWWLFFILILLNAVDLLLFVVLDLDSVALKDLPTGIKVLNGVFQAASTRTAGFASVNLSLLHPAVQVSYMIMMYISVFPIAISVRRTNVYEEQSLGVYAGGDENQNESEMSYVGAHLRRQLSFDLWYIFVGLFIISISEGARLQANDFSLFAVLFEIVSAYGTVGLSLGYTGVNASLVSQFSVVGKLVIIAMQVRGRHRGLPYGLDRAILLPSESLNEKESADAEARLQRRNSVLSNQTMGGPGTSLHRGRSRTSVDRGGGFLGSLLQPGPAAHAFDTPPVRRRSYADFDDVGPADSPRVFRRSQTVAPSAIGNAGNLSTTSLRPRFNAPHTPQI